MEIALWVVGGIIVAFFILWLLKIALAFGIVFLSIRKMAAMMEETDREFGHVIKDKAYYRKQAWAELKDGLKNGV